MPKVRATIVQISDLHMNRRVNKNVLSMLTDIVKGREPHILIVSGDQANQPLPWQMHRAAKFVEGLRSACPQRPDLVVIPGNHDYKFWGNVGLRRLTRVPYEIYFHRNGLEASFWQRFKWYWALGLNAFWPWGRQMREPLVFHDDAELGVTVVGFNSNSLAEMMAAGKVGAQDFQEMFRRIIEAGHDPAFPFRYKIAVVHHHPAPIADMPTGFSARIEESFMVFYNAGLFVRELSRRNFNLVLHGHKHFAGFLRVACEFKDKGRTDLPIAAAGTAAHPTPDDPRGHHLHVVELYDDDTANLTSWFFTDSVCQTDASATYTIATVEDVLQRRQAIFREELGASFGEIRKTASINVDGYTEVRVENLDGRPFGPDGIDRWDIALRAPSPSYLRRVEASTGSGMPRFGKLERQAQTLREFEGVLHFGETYRGCDRFDFGFQYRLMNAHTLTAEEFARHYAGTGTEWEFASLLCSEACDKLTLVVEFPENYHVHSDNFTTLAEYTPAPLEGVRNATADNWQRHDSETVRANKGLSIEKQTVTLRCNSPIPGVVYRIRWKHAKVHTPSTAPLQAAGQVSRTKKELLKIARAAAQGQANAVKAHNEVQALLDLLAQDLRTYFQGPVREKLEVSVLVFDEEDSRLRFVAANFGKIEDLIEETFIAGEGCAGFVFDTMRPLLYHPALDTNDYFITPQERTREDGSMRLPDAKAMACVPWTHPNGRVLGVANVSSCVDDSGLLRLFDLPESEQGQGIRRLQEFLWLATERLIALQLT